MNGCLKGEETVDILIVRLLGCYMTDFRNKVNLERYTASVLPQQWFSGQMPVKTRGEDQSKFTQSGPAG